MDEAEFKKLIRKGASVELDPAIPASQRKVQAKWIIDLVKSSSHRMPHSLVVLNAIVDGDLDMAGTTFDHVVTFEHCEFLGAVHFGFARFASILSFLGSTFRQDVALHSVSVGDHLNLVSTRFNGRFSVADANVARMIVCVDSQFRTDSDWVRCTVDGSIDCSGSSFMGQADFTRLTVRDSAFFRASSQVPYTRFEGRSSFDHASVGRQFDFAGAQFIGDASFRQAKAGQDLFFRPSEHGLRVNFHGTADFSHLVTTGNFEADGSYFHGPVLFEMANIGGSLVMRPDGKLSPVWFDCGANFTQLRCGKSAVFRGAQFRDDANFTQASIGGLLSFSKVEGGPAARIHGDLNLPFVTVGGQLELQEIKVTGRGEFFRLNVTGLTIFDGAQFGADLSLHAGVFKDALTFEAGENGDVVIIGGSLDARFCTVSRYTMFERTFIAGCVDFSHSHLGLGASFRGISFSKGAKFGRVNIEGPMFIGLSRMFRSYVGEEIDLDDAQILGDLIIENLDVGSVMLQRSAVKGDCVLGGLSCLGTVDARRCSVDGSLRFARTSSGAKFSKFFKSVDISFATVGQQLEVQGGWFFGGLNGHRTQIGDSFFIRDRGIHQPELRVSVKATFSQSQINGQLIVTGGRFVAQLDLSGVTVGKEIVLRATNVGEQNIRPLVLIHGVQGNSLKSLSSISFEDVIFLGPANLESLDVSGSLEMSNVLFVEELMLPGTRVVREIVLGNIHCRKQVSLRQVSAATIWLYHRGEEEEVRKSGKRLLQRYVNRQTGLDAPRYQTESVFRNGIDLRGIKCNRFEVADWQRLNIQPFDLQPFLEIERGLRHAGRGAEADALYIAAMKRETHNRSQLGGFWAPFAVLIRWLYWLIAGYGVKPLRFFGWVGALVFLGSIIFAQAEAITPGERPNLCKGGVTRFDAVLISAQTLVPFGRQLSDTCQPASGQAVDLPLLSFMDVATFAALESLAGWIFTPVAAAVAFEQLRKKRG